MTPLATLLLIALIAALSAYAVSLAVTLWALWHHDNPGGRRKRGERG